MMNKWLHIIQNSLYPPTCLLCGDPGADDLDLCRPCAASLPYLGHVCPSCGEILDAPATTPIYCGRCQTQCPAFDRTRALFHYRGPVRYLIQHLKFNGNLACARLLGELMAERLSSITPRPQLLIPVPLHQQRYRERGFNQTIEIAKIVASRLELPLDLHTCRRTRPTPPQSGLPAQQRRNNLQGAFEVCSPLRATHVAILDDVITTGTTVDRMAAVLRRSGVKKIEVWACARA